jgi:hypothetical protein
MSEDLNIGEGGFIFSFHATACRFYPPTDFFLDGMLRAA